ncbi:UNVERIFIED_CONTAM: hypothetical protein Sindi_2584000 [Sesamum indicum]
MVLAKAAKLEQTMLHQRAKMEWMKDGDQCSRVFFRKIAQRRATRRILQINDEHGITHMEQEVVINEFVSYYRILLGGQRRRDMIDIRFLRPWARHLVTEDETNSLLSPFTPSDVKEEVFDIAEDKAPGPNGYSSGFFKAAWPIVEARLLKQINTTLLALIPKVHSPMSVGDFRPISCCNVLYKIIAKLIVKRLSVVLDKVISPCQAAFVPGRSIGDNIMLAQELFSGYNQSRLPHRCTSKVDIRKAYDSVEWDFLVAECVTTPSFSVGLNGKPHGFFSGARGLRQGDPLSPYLFVLVMEVLHLGYLQMIDQDGLFSFHWKCDSARIFQLGFADDLLLFCRADMDSIEVLKRGLDRFAVWSGLRLNVQKSHLIISWSTQGLCDEMLEALGFQEGLLPLRYLGLPLLSSRLTIADCQPLLVKIDKRIAGWEGMTLSYAGRVQIIKSVLMSLSFYWASAFILPKRVTNEIEKRLRNFLRKGPTNSGYAKVAWKELCRPVDKGGLGHFHMDNPRSWRFMELEETPASTDFSPSYGGLPNRRWAKFHLWQDPLLRLEESAKLSTVINGGEWQWPLITDFECLEITHVLPTIRGGDDRIVWRFDQGRPTTQSLYSLFDLPGPKVGWTLLLSGSLKIPRHLFILWLAILGKLPTTDKPGFSRQCLTTIRRKVRFHWPNRDWVNDIEWASHRWRGKHIVNIAYRALLASSVYHIWRERNIRRFEQRERTPSTMALLIVDDVRQRIISISLASSVSTRALYRLWRIPWPVEGETTR